MADDPTGVLLMHRILIARALRLAGDEPALAMDGGIDGLQRSPLMTNSDVREAALNELSAVTVEMQA